MPYKFKFFKPGETTPNFECNLKSERCSARNNNNVRCKKTTVIGLPLCWIHLLSKKHLRIKESTIANAGKGLFALDKSAPANAILFRKGDKIIDYYGEQVNAAELDNRYGDYTAPYGIEINQSQDLYEDGACQRGIGNLANHADDTHANAKLTTETVHGREKIILTARKIIRNNEEIFVNYGSTYGFTENTRYSTKYSR